MIRFLKRFLLTVLALLAVAACCVLAVDFHVAAEGRKYLIYEYEGESAGLPGETDAAIKDFDADCILVLGAGIKDTETPTDMLQDRLDAGIALYYAGAAPKLLLSGDNGTNWHNEIHVMLTYCLEAGVPAEDIFCDHAGFSTQESMLRARDIFGAERVIVVTQKYHELRALYIGKKIGLEVLGVSSSQRDHSGQIFRDVREIAARNKDFYMLLLGLERAVGGEPYDLSGDGRATHGE